MQARQKVMSSGVAERHDLLKNSGLVLVEQSAVLEFRNRDFGSNRLSSASFRDRLVLLDQDCFGQ